LNAQETLEGKGLLTLFCHSRIAKTVKFW
jgi:hypothetical protein